MKIAHINIIFSKKNMSGVEKKLLDEAEAMAKKGIAVYLLNREKDCFENNIHYVDIDSYIKDFIFKELYIRMFKYQIIDQLVDLKKYDNFILRYSLIDFSAFIFAKKYKNRFITEHHTKELKEIKVQKIKEPFKTLQYLLEKYGAKYFFRYAKGIIGVSKDIINSVEKRTNLTLKSFVLSNGIKNSMNDIDKANKSKFPNNELHMLFIASRFQEWHGLDRLLKSLEDYNYSKKIILHLVGELEDKYLEMIDEINKTSKKVNIIIHGKLDRNELSKIYTYMNIACDSLAMFRIGMKESSTLKSKEYVVYNLPFLYSASDADFQTIKKYLFDCGNDEEFIDMEEIIKQYENINFSEMYQDFDRCKTEILSWDSKIEKLFLWIKGCQSQEKFEVNNEIENF